MRHSGSLFGTLVLAALVALAATTLPASADPPDPNGAWGTLSVAPGPGPRDQHVAVYDPLQDRMIVFGGAETIQETWSLSLGASPAWTNISPGLSPSGRKASAIVYDSARNRAILFGGYDGNYRNDVWTLPLSGPPLWTQMALQGTSPSARLFALAIYDPLRDRVIVFGGTPGSLNDTWELTLSGIPQWNQLTVSGTPPSARYGACGVYDPVGDRIILFGGSAGGNETWSLDLSGTPTWTQLNPSTRPTARAYATAIYDSQRARMVLYGGMAGASEVWGLTLGASPQWTLLTPTGTASSRVLHVAVYQPSRNRMVVFGGTGSPNDVRTLQWSNQTIATTTTLHLGPQYPVCGEALACSVLVDPPSATGVAEVRFDGDLLTTLMLVNGRANVQVPMARSGDHTFTASYSGDQDHFASSSPVVTQFILPIATAVSVTPEHNPAVFGEDVVLTGEVTPLTALGKIDFYVNGNLFTSGNIPVVNGRATVLLPRQPAGPVVLTTRFIGDTCYSASVSPPFLMTVNPVGTSVAMTASSNPALVANAVTLSASVMPSTATGTIEFFDGATPLGTASMSNASASLATTQLTLGVHSLTAVYSGDANHQGSTSPVFLETITSPNPVIIAVRDVPNDQGARVYLTWRCPIDKPGIHIVTGYRVWRRVPNGEWLTARNGGDTPEPMQDVRTLWIPRADGVLEETFWEAIASLPAEGLINYGYTAPTTQDSLPDNPNYTAFFVTALTTDPWTFYESAVDSGYSIDNLAPEAPMSFAGSYQAGTVVMTWNPGFEPDVAHYVLHRGGTADFVADSSTLIATTTDTTFSDPRTDPSYYKLATVDAHGNVGAFASLTAFGLLDAGHGDVARFALEPLIPNPSHGPRLTVRFSLPDGAPASLELLDVQGRRIEKREVGGLGAGRHTQVLSDRGGLAPGVYVIRFSRGGESLTRIGAVVR